MGDSARSAFSTLSKLATGYLIATLLNAIGGLIAVPVIIGAVGPVAWSGLALSQTIGSVAYVGVSLGWALVGPATLSSMTPQAQGDYYLRATRSRAILFVGCAPVYLTAVAALNVDGTSLWANALAGGTLLIIGLGGSWYFVGIGSAKLLVLLDTLPRLIGTLLGIVLLFTGGSLLSFAMMQVLGASCAAVFAWKHARKRAGAVWTGSSLRMDLLNIRAAAAPALTAGAATAFVNMPLVLVSIIAASDLSIYALADKLQKSITTALGPIVSVFQSLAPRVTGLKRLHRVRTIACFAIPALLGFPLALIPIFPTLANLFSRGQINIPFPMTLAFTIVIASIFASGLLGLVGLVTLGLTHHLATSTVVGAAVGTICCIVLGLFAGAIGIAWGVAIAELTVVGYQVVVVIRATRPA